MIIIGIDPGIERLGWGILEKAQRELKWIDSGVKKTLKTKSEEERFLEISDFVDGLCKKFHPDLICVERIFFSTNVKTAVTIGGVRGIVMTAGARHKIKIKEFAPLEIKLAICGYGKADKQAVWHMIKLALKLPLKKFLDDESDALAIALSGAYIMK